MPATWYSLQLTAHNGAGHRVITAQVTYFLTPSNIFYGKNIYASGCHTGQLGPDAGAAAGRGRGDAAARGGVGGGVRGRGGRQRGRARDRRDPGDHHRHARRGVRLQEEEVSSQQGL